MIDTAVLVRPFDNHTNQWNFGIDHAQTPWVLCIDADYVCPKEFQQEVELLEPKCDAYFAAFRYLINGRPLKATLYPPRAVLFRKARFRYVADGHTQLLNVEGAKIGTLKSVIDHDDRKALAHWLASQSKYAVLEAEKLASSTPANLGWKDRLRLQIAFAPFLTAVYCLFWRLLILDGRAGLFYTLQRVYAELLLSLELLDRKLKREE